jgi:hypothetical protein
MKKSSQNSTVGIKVFLAILFDYRWIRNRNGTSDYRIRIQAVLRIRIRDPGLGAF